MILAQGMFFTFWEGLPVLTSAAVTLAATFFGVLFVIVGMHRAGWIIGIVAAGVGVAMLIVSLFVDETAAGEFIVASPILVGFVLLIHAAIAGQTVPIDEAAAPAPPGEPGAGAAPVLAYARRPRHSRPAVRNWAGLASVALGFLGCIPYITGLAAVVFALIGLHKGKNPDTGDRWLAWVGLILGGMSLALWCAPLAFELRSNLQIAPAEAASQQFLRDLVAGNSAAALAQCDGVTPGQIQSAMQKLAGAGASASVHFDEDDCGMRFDQWGTMDINGDGSAANGGSWYFEMQLGKRGGAYKVVDMRITVAH